MSDTSTVRIGIAGTGNLGTTLGRQFQDCDGAEITALADISPEALDDAGTKFDVMPMHRYTEYEEMLSDAPIDAVAIATPHAFHYEQTSAALDRELDVLCEKPLAIDLEDARALVKRDEASDEILMVGYQRHLYPPFAEARRRLRESKGDTSYVAAETTQEWIESFRTTWRGDPDMSGGGQLYDTGSHLIDAVLWVGDLQPQRIYAEMDFDDDAERVDKHAALTIRFEGGAVGTITVSGDTRQRYEHLHFSNDEGGVRIEKQSDVYVYDRDGDQRELEVDRSSGTPKAAAFVKAVRERSTPPATAQQAYTVTAVTEAAYESARSGKPIDINPAP